MPAVARFVISPSLSQLPSETIDRLVQNIARIRENQGFGQIRIKSQAGRITVGCTLTDLYPTAAAGLALPDPEVLSALIEDLQTWWQFTEVTDGETPSATFNFSPQEISMQLSCSHSFPL